MARRPAPNKNEIAHITIQCNNKESLLNISKTFHNAVSWFNCFPCVYNIKIHHILFMSNHIHMLLTPTENNMGEAMKYTLTNLSKYLNWFNNRKNHNFRNRYGPTIIRSYKHLINVIRYIYQNPIRAGITNNPFEYPYSSLGFYSGENNKGIMLTPDEYTKDSFSFGARGREQWLNLVSDIIDGYDLTTLRKSLQKKEFLFTKKQLKSISTNKTKLVI